MKCLVDVLPLIPKNAATVAERKKEDSRQKEDRARRDDVALLKQEGYPFGHGRKCRTCTLGPVYQSSTDCFHGRIRSSHLLRQESYSAPDSTS